MNQLEIYRKVKLIREVEERIRKIYHTDVIKSPVHLSVGHEAIAVGVCQALNTNDQIFGYYRSHAIYLAKGGDLNAMFAELYGKQDGCARGWGGSMHLVSNSVGVNSTTAIVASSVPNAVGMAYAAKYQKTEQVVVSFFGDGATEEGVVWESLNFAALHRLPILFVCENNGLAIHTHQHQRQAITGIAQRAAAFGVESHEADGSDPRRVFTLADTAVQRIREGSGPVFLELTTSRWLEHVGPGEDWNLGYREEGDVEPWRSRDAVGLLEQTMREEMGQSLAEQVIAEINQEIQQQIEDAIAFAEQSPFPAAEELMNYVYR